ncbi:MAG: ion transporter [Deltaproteobacteria bacterium]|nr:ion transporter [Deltaproteobacteria bacterium]
MNSFRETIQFYLVDSKTPLGKLIDICIIILNFVICAILVVETYDVSEATRSLLWNTEVIIVAFFIIEYAARLYGSQDRLKQLVDIYSVIDLIAILPTVALLVCPIFGVALNVGFLRLIRAFRVFRIFRFLRYARGPGFFFKSITVHVLKGLQLLMTIFMIFFISSGLFYAVESSVNPTVRNFGDAFYFTVVTLTTVGFGDIIPLSEGGRTVTVVMILSGIILIPWQVGRLIKEWIHIASKQDITCSQCGLRYHDRDASHCKSCGNVIYQEYEDG